MMYAYLFMSNKFIIIITIDGFDCFNRLI